MPRCVSMLVEQSDIRSDCKIPSRRQLQRPGQVSDFGD